MDADRYQTLAMRTFREQPQRRDELINCALGMAGEAGEVADLVKKHAFHSHPLDERKVLLEIGDVLWYAATMCDSLGVTLSHVMDMNIEKLNARYPSPDGFEVERSMNRTEVA